MEQAKRFQENKAGGYQKGALGLAGSAITSGFGIASSLFGGLKNSKIGQTLGGFMPAIGKISGMLEQKAGAMADSKREEGAKRFLQHPGGELY